MNRETTQEGSSQSRAVLPLIEQIIMVLVFMIAAAVCMRSFVHADSLSKQNAQRDRALLLAQNAIETMKGAGGDYRHAAEALADSLGRENSAGAPGEDSVLIFPYDKNWQPAQEGSATHYLYVQALTGGLSPVNSENFVAARVWVWERGKSRAPTLDPEQGRTIVDLEFGWQKEATEP